MSVLLLVSAPAATAMSWVRRGVVPCHVAEQHGWTLVSGGGRTAAAAPYDDPTSVLLARPAGPRVAPTLGLGVLGERAVVVTQASGWRAVKRWGVRPRLGPVLRDPGLPHLRPGDLAPFAGTRTSTAEVAEHLADRTLPAQEWLAQLLEVLRLPGAEVVRDGARPGPLVQPDARAVSAFERVVQDGRP